MDVELDSDPDPVIFVNDPQDVNKKLILLPEVCAAVLFEHVHVVAVAEAYLRFVPLYCLNMSML